MKISVIIPYFNNPENLRLVLYNLQNIQTRQPDEIIIIDDDSTTENVESLHVAYNFIYQKTDIKKDGQHRAGHARNKGASLATGNILVFQDQDIILGKHYIEEIYNYYKGHASVVTGMFEDINSDVQSLDNKFLFEYLNEKDDWLMKTIGNKENLAKVIRTIPEVAESRQFAIPKKQFHEVGGFNENFIGWGCEDTEFFWRNLHTFNYQIYISRRLYSYHLEHPVDPVYLIESMRRNAEYFVELYPEVKTRLMHLWKGFGVFYPNPRIERALAFCKKIRKEQGIKDFGVLPSMRSFGLWRY